MQKICHLHLGQHKTASTSFQQTCSRNVDLLKRSGITYPIFKCLAANNRTIGNHSIPISSLFRENPRNYHINQRWGICDQIEQVNQSYERQLENYLESSDNLLISGEDISLLMEHELSRFVEKIKTYNYEIKPFALIRNPYSALCSTIQQLIRGGHYVGLISLNNCFAASPKSIIISFAQIAKILRSVFGESIVFYNFEHVCANQYGPVGFLLKELLNQDPSEFNYVKSNESLYNLTVRIQNELNKSYPSFADGKFIPEFQAVLPRLNKHFAFSGSFLLTEREHAMHEDFLRREANDLRDIVGLDFLDRPLSFSEPIL
jgi:hypothetical protein